MVTLLVLNPILTGLLTAFGSLQASELPMELGTYRFEDMACLKGAWNLDDGEGDVYSRLVESFENSPSSLTVTRDAEGNPRAQWASPYYTAIFVPSYSSCRIEVEGRLFNGDQNRYSLSADCPPQERKEICARFSAFYRLNLACDGLSGFDLYTGALRDDPLEKIQSYQRVGKTIFARFSETKACVEMSTGAYSGTDIGLVLKQTLAD